MSQRYVLFHKDNAKDVLKLIKYTDTDVFSAYKPWPYIIQTTFFDYAKHGRIEVMLRDP